MSLPKTSTIWKKIDAREKEIEESFRNTTIGRRIFLLESKVKNLEKTIDRLVLQVE